MPKNLSGHTLGRLRDFRPLDSDKTQQMIQKKFGSALRSVLAVELLFPVYLRPPIGHPHQQDPYR